MSYAFVNGEWNLLDENLKKLYAFYFGDQNIHRIEKTKILIGILGVIKTIEEKLIGAKLLKERGNFTADENQMILDFQEKWAEFKEHNFANSTDHKNDKTLEKMKELMAKVFSHLRAIQSLPTEMAHLPLGSSAIYQRTVADGNEMDHSLAQFQLRLFCQILAKIGPNDELSFPLWQLREILKVRAPVGPEVFQKLKILLGDGIESNILPNIKKLSSVLNEAIDSLPQIDLEIFLPNNMPPILKPEIWLHPEIYEFFQPENSALITGTTNSHHDEDSLELKSLLREKYALNEEDLNIRDKVENKIAEHVIRWLIDKLHKNGNEFSLYVGGSTMLDTNDKQTDMDITIILPEITLKDGECDLNKDSPVSDLCRNKSLHDAILSVCCTNSLLRQLDGAYSVGDPERSGLRLIRHTLAGIKVDLTFVMLPLPFLPPEINVEINLAAHNSKSTIKHNVGVMKSLLGQMCAANVNLNKKGIRALSSFLFVYRLKFLTIEVDHRREIFTNLIQAVKLWAKAQHIYSSVLGYLSGTSITIMAAKICLLYPTGNLTFLLEKFFLIFSMWDWPKPVIVDYWNISEYRKGTIEAWEPVQIVTKNEQMPIIMSQYPDTNTAFNVNGMNRKVIHNALRNAYDLFKQRRSISSNERPHFWENSLFKKANYEKDYDHYFLITCSNLHKHNWEAACASTKWDMRNKLNNWWEGQTIGNIRLKEHLNLYHMFTGFEYRRICAIKEVECMAWMVGIKFKQKSSTEHPMKEQQEEHKKKSSPEHLTREQQEEFMKSFISYNIEENVKITFAMNKAELEERINSTLSVNVRNSSQIATTSVSQFGHFGSGWRSYVAAYITELQRQKQQRNLDYRHQHQLELQHHLQLQQQLQLHTQQLLEQQHPHHYHTNPINAASMIYSYPHITEYISPHQNSNILPSQQQQNFVPIPDHSVLQFQPEPFSPAAEFDKVLSEMYPGIQHPVHHNLFQQQQQSNIYTHPTIIHQIPHQAQILSPPIDQQLNRQNTQQSPAQGQNPRSQTHGLALARPHNPLESEAQHPHNAQQGGAQRHSPHQSHAELGQHLQMRRPHSADTQYSRVVIRTGQNSIRGRNRDN